MDVSVAAGERIGPSYDYEITPQSDMTYVVLFAGIALFIVLIAAVNFVNLTTARATRRAGEIGVRKALVVGQFSLSALLVVTALESQYRSELNFRQVAGVFAALAIFIACLGMPGLISYTAARRRREFGIRKVIGATTRDLALLMAGGFMKLVGLALIISWPLAWIVMSVWLDEFAYAVDPGIGPFVYPQCL